MAELASDDTVLPASPTVVAGAFGAPRSVAWALRGTATLATSFLLAAATVLLTEWLARGNLNDIGAYMLSPARPGYVLVGLLFLVYLALDAILGRAHQSALIILPIALLPAFLSAQKQLFLSDPLYPSDLLFGRQIMELLPVMVAARPLAAVGVAAATIAAIASLVYFWVFARRNFRTLSAPGKLLRLVVALPVIGLFLPLLDYAVYSPLRDRMNMIPMMWDQQENYRHNGFLLAFAFNVPMANVAAPVGYGQQAIDAIAPTGAAAGLDPNRQADIIMVMSESLWDPTRLTNVTLTPDPMPVMRARQSGNIFSPEFGGMTANVEFEALTGFSNAFLPYGSIPYQQYVRRPLPSLATFFRSKGYEAKAFHPFQSWFWNRANVYESLGFESFLSEENLPPMEKRGIFASDASLTDELIRVADKTKDPFFFFAVTLQGHGPYEHNRYKKNTIAVDAPPLSPQSTGALATYAQGVKEADDSLKRLMDWAKKRQRETIIVIFGDHLPPLGTVYPESGYMAQQVATRKASPARMAKEHETPLIVWSSKRGVQKDLGSISPSQLPYHIVKLAGYRHPFYTGLLGDVQERYAVVDRYQLIDKDGRGHPDWLAPTATIDPVLRDYRLLQHDVIFGDAFGIDRNFPEQRMLSPAS